MSLLKQSAAIASTKQNVQPLRKFFIATRAQLESLALAIETQFPAAIVNQQLIDSAGKVAAVSPLNGTDNSVQFAAVLPGGGGHGIQVWSSGKGTMTGKLAELVWDPNAEPEPAPRRRSRAATKVAA